MKSLIEDPEKTKDHIANYFEQLYQAREGTAPYAEWTNKIKTQVRKNLEKDPDTATETEDQISEKEMNAAIKKLKRNKAWALTKSHMKSSSRQTKKQEKSWRKY